MRHFWRIQRHQSDTRRRAKARGREPESRGNLRRPESQRLPPALEAASLLAAMRHFWRIYAPLMRHRCDSRSQKWRMAESLRQYIPADAGSVLALISGATLVVEDPARWASGVSKKTGGCPKTSARVREATTERVRTGRVPGLMHRPRDQGLTLVMPGPDPGIQRTWIAGSSPAMTGESSTCADNLIYHSRGRTRRGAGAGESRRPPSRACRRGSSRRSRR
jgi:hypothetical protein